MDMMTRSAVLAAMLVIVAAAAGGAWWLYGDRITREPDPLPDSGAFRDFDNREGSLRDEFGESNPNGNLDDRIRIVTGSGLDIPPPPPAGTVDGLPSGPQFGWDRPERSGTGRSGNDRLSFNSGPSEPLPRTTAAERVEADCRGRGGGSYACRCLVRLARTALAPEEFEFLSLAEELDPRTDRLTSAGLALTDLSGLSVKLVELDANARRRCGSGLKPGR